MFWSLRARSTGYGVVGALLVMGCSETSPDEQRLGRLRAAIEADQQGKVFALATDLSSQRSVQARYRELADRATGALLTPFITAQGAPLFTASGGRVRGTCGVTFVSPSYAVTAAHCVNSANADLQQLEVEMYRPGSALEQNVWKSVTLTGAFPNFAHETLTLADGYGVDRFGCTLVARCSENYGGRLACPLDASPNADAALLHCSGSPGRIYGWVELASVDEPTADVFMPYKHEIYTGSSEPGSDFVNHYVLAGSAPEDNYHYFGADSSQREQNQLLPLTSVELAPGVPHRKVSFSDDGVITDLMGCHGSSGAGALQPGAEGRYQLLGPMVGGNHEHDTYLCNHVPALDGFSREPGCLGISYGALAITQSLVAGFADTLRLDRDSETALGAEDATNTFDAFAARSKISLVDLDEPSAPSRPMRFVGDGKHGFAARLLPHERLLLAPQAWAHRRLWFARFSVSNLAALRCGFVDAASAELLSADCSSGFVQFDASGSALDAGAAFFVETSTTSSAVELDDLTLVSDAQLDSDGDGIPDAVDDCENGLTHIGAVLTVTPSVPAVFETCTPEPVHVPLSPPSILGACSPPQISGRITKVNGRTLTVPVDANALLPLGKHDVLWSVADGSGRLVATSESSVEIREVHAAGCAPLSILGGSNAALLFASPGANYVAGGDASDYLAGNGGDNVLLGGNGDDYIASGRGGNVVIFAGDGNDTVHANLASSARIFGGRGRDVLIASSGNDTVFPGRGALAVLLGAGNDTLQIYDACELERGAHFSGGQGFDTLITPFSLAALRTAGVEVDGFESIVLDSSRAYLSPCFAEP